jgi:hypothetical protein
LKDILKKGDKMFLHIGGEVSALIQDILFILDWKATKSDCTAAWLAQRGVVDICEKNVSPASLVVTDTVIFISPVSAFALKRRLEQAAILFCGN